MRPSSWSESGIFGASKWAWRIEPTLARIRPALALLLFVLGSFLVFLPALFNDYAYDGKDLIERASLPRVDHWGAFLDPDRFAPVSGNLSWRPLSALSFFALDCLAFGRCAALSHALDLILHGVNACLLFAFCKRLLETTKAEAPRSLALLGALLFLVHPLVSEVVLCTGFRADSMAMLFVLGTVVAALRVQEIPGTDSVQRSVGIGVVAISYLLALGSKEVGVVALPLAPLAVLGVTRSPREALRLFALLLGITGLFGLLWLRFRASYYPTAYLGGNGRMLGVANALVASCEVYLRKLFLPWPMRISYLFEPIPSLWHPRFARAAVLLMLTLAAGLALARASVLFLLGLAWTLAALLPVSQMVPVPDPVAERFCYVAMGGVALMVVAIARAQPRIATGRLPAAALCLGLLSLAMLSHRRAYDWKDDLVLNIRNWEQAQDRRPRALENLGALYLARAEQLATTDPEATAAALEQARLNLEALLAIDVGAPAPNCLLARISLMRGGEDEALRLLGRALVTDPTYHEARALRDSLQNKR